MPPGIPPMLFPPDDDALEIELQHVAARAVMHIRHPDIPIPLLPDLVVYDDALRAEYQALLAKLRPSPEGTDGNRSETNADECQYDFRQQGDAR